MGSVERMNDFQTLKITAHLQTPVLTDGFLPLDGVVYEQCIRASDLERVHSLPRQSHVQKTIWEQFGEGRFETAPIFDQKLGYRMPFQKRNRNDGDNHYYACSFAVWPDQLAKGPHEFSKRFDSHLAADYADFEGKRGKVDTQRGPYKALWVKERAWSAPFVSWYCRGNKSTLEKILPFCTHIGKKSSQGCGSVLRWEIEATEKDWYLKGENGELMRAVPSENGNVLYGIRPSYWLAKHQKMCKLPKLP